MRIIADRLQQPRAYRVSHHIPGDRPKILLLSYRAVVKTFLPHPPASTKKAIDLDCGARLHPQNQSRQIGLLQCHKPVQMIGHDNKRPGCRPIQRVGSTKLVYQQTCTPEIPKYRLSSMRHRRDQIGPPGLRPAPLAQIAPMRSARSRSPLAGDPCGCNRRTVARKRAPTGHADSPINRRRPSRSLQKLGDALFSISISGPILSAHSCLS